MKSKLKSTKTLGVIINGPINDDPSLIKKISACQTIFLVDGGANYFYHLIQNFNVKKPADALIGDFDSIDPKILDYFKKQSTTIITLERSKDQTDFEIALEYALKYYPSQSISAYGCVGGRVDHTLANLWLLARLEQRMSFESSKERIFSVASHLTLDPEYPFLSCVSLFGKPKKVMMTEENNKIIPFPQDFFIYTQPILDCDSLHVEGGPLICIQHCEPESSTLLFFHTLQKLIEGEVNELEFESEKLFLIKKNKGLTLPVSIGQTISLIPLFGSVEGVTTKGLKWELTDALLDFVGISNVALLERCSISVKKGVLLCAVNTLIDHDIVNRA